MQFNMQNIGYKCFMAQKLNIDNVKKQGKIVCDSFVFTLSVIKNSFSEGDYQIMTCLLATMVIIPMMNLSRLKL